MDNSLKIKAVIKEFAGSQTALADALGVSVQVVNNWCRRGVNSYDTINKIVELYPALNIAYFFDDAAPMLKSALQPAAGKELQISGGGVAAPAEAGTVNRLLDELAAQRSMTEKSQDQIDRLLTIIENLQKR